MKILITEYYSIILDTSIMKVLSEKELSDVNIICIFECSQDPWYLPIYNNSPIYDKFQKLKKLELFKPKYKTISDERYVFGYISDGKFLNDDNNMTLIKNFHYLDYDSKFADSIVEICDNNKYQSPYYLMNHLSEITKINEETVNTRPIIISNYNIDEKPDIYLRFFTSRHHTNLNINNALKSDPRINFHCIIEINYSKNGYIVINKIEYLAEFLNKRLKIGGIVFEFDNL